MIYEPSSVLTDQPIVPESKGTRAPRATIFETPVGSDAFNAMPRSSNDSEVLRTATGLAGMHQNMRPGNMMPVDRNVRNVQRPRRGYGY